MSQYPQCRQSGSTLVATNGKKKSPYKRCQKMWKHRNRTLEGSWQEASVIGSARAEGGPARLLPPPSHPPLRYVSVHDISEHLCSHSCWYHTFVLIHCSRAPQAVSLLAVPADKLPCYSRSRRSTTAELCTTPVYATDHPTHCLAIAVCPAHRWPRAFSQRNHGLRGAAFLPDLSGCAICSD
jgi:hypothetical protein